LSPTTTTLRELFETCSGSGEVFGSPSPDLVEGLKRCWRPTVPGKTDRQIAKFFAVPIKKVRDWKRSNGLMDTSKRDSQ
jgi:hypothetical protein